MIRTEGMRFTKYNTPIDLYAGLRVKTSFRPNLEQMSSLDSTGLEAPTGSLRIGIVHVPASMIERRKGHFAPAPSPADQERIWVVAEFPGKRYAALGQFVPEVGYHKVPERKSLEYCMRDAR